MLESFWQSFAFFARSLFPIHCSWLLQQPPVFIVFFFPRGQKNLLGIGNIANKTEKRSFIKPREKLSISVQTV
jgi:hypothetical protein